MLIPETYVADLQVRLGLYRRLADLADQTDLDGFAAELHDRFGRVPEEVQHLLEVVSIKLLCREANVPERRCRPQGRRHRVPQWRLRQSAEAGRMDHRPGDARKAPPRDMKLVIMRSWDRPEERLKGTRQLMQTLVKLAA